ncbi:inositol monophosphatase family protein [Heliophilum fasciatum]|uniref:Inositol-1-monophosphatase n=1 Tax=Heliophilum fasciatum TaxID=35700 RepID=A0A4R2S1E5_9FIRM|nr:inositol monophosphatase family protein [Heliophilum fasciatum]MCW2276600.1 myo-inositol-1(or 4)-monophosphatase [Heliophilum fasciatum]TCP69017.1 myo-inositol-1(or 4)-monophosphatase [Heliophilum fasciatum]
MIKELSAIIKSAGDIVRTANMDIAKVEEKSGPGNFVTQYDVAVQDFLFKELQRLLPEAGFLGEEGEQAGVLTDGYCFIVDPIDGTANFARNYRHSAISLGLALNRKMIVGLVYNPYLDELFYAEAGKGAFLNDRPIVSSNKGLKEGIVLFGTSPYNREKTDETFLLAKRLYEHSLDVRRSGSAALDICYVASGRCELYYELVLSPWDFAAAPVIIGEAGGLITTLQGDALQLDKKNSVLAAGSNAYRDFWNICSRTPKAYGDLIGEQ